MKLIKFEKHNCPKCVLVENFLQDNEVKYEKIDIENYDDLDFISKYVSMSVPVTVLLDDNGNEIIKSTGFVPSELEEIVEKLQG